MKRADDRSGGVRGLAALQTLALRNAEGAIAAGNHAEALEWLERVPAPQRPAHLVAEAHYGCAKAALAAGAWGLVEEHLRAANRAVATPLFQARLSLVRRREPLVDDHTWTQMGSTIDLPARLDPTFVTPEISYVAACGAYHSRGRDSGSPWSRFLRMSKDPPPVGKERDAILSMSTGYFCRFLLEMTDFCGRVDAVIAVPTNPDRYLHRHMSLPEELASGVEKHLAIPYLPRALTSAADPDLRMRGLSWSERRATIRGTMTCLGLAPAEGRTILVVDDVVTSGATLKEAGRGLRAAGAKDVLAATLSHTEG